MAEVNSFEFSLPECVIKHIQSMNPSDGNCLLTWEGEISQAKDTASSTGRRRHKQKRIDRTSGCLNNKVQILAEMKQDGMLLLKIDKLNLKIVENKFCCVISSAKLTCAGDAGDPMGTDTNVELNYPETSTDTFTDHTNEGDYDSSMCATSVIAPGELCDDDEFKTKIAPNSTTTNDRTRSHINENVMADDVSDAITQIHDPDFSHLIHIPIPSEKGEFSHGLDLKRNTETIAQQPTLIVPVAGMVEKKKRGRPRKNNQYVSPAGASMKRENLQSLSSSFESNSTTKGGYCLRGAKLRKDLMAAEKGETDADYDDEIVSDQSLSQNQPVEDSEFNSDTDGDLENNSSKVEKYSEESSTQEPRTLEGRMRKSTSSKNSDDADHVFGNLPKSTRRPRNNVKVAKCKYCGKMFCDFTGVLEHVKKFHYGEEDLSAYSQELQQLQVVKCKLCNMEFKSRYHLHSHENRVHGASSGTASTTCKICEKSFKSLLSLRSHVKYVHQHTAKEHLCHLCPAKFKWANTLKQHVEEIHIGSEGFSCDTCGKSFSRKAQLNRHVRIHGADSSKKIYCPVCEKAFWFETNLQRHRRAIHSPQVESFHCSYCGKGFSQKASMLSHVQLTHFHLFPFSCKLCVSGFSRSKLLVKHMRTFHMDKNFKLPNSKSRRHRFKYNRSPDDLFYCSYCSASFFYKAKMVEHMHKTHSKDFPFFCKTCDQGFLLKKFLVTHKHAAHGEPRSGSDCEHGEDSNSNSPKHDSTSKRSTFADDANAAAIAVMGIDGSGNIERELNENEQMETSGFDEAFEMSNTEAAASLLVEVASGNMTTHYIIQSKDQSEYQDTSPAVIAHDIASLFLAAESSMQALSTDQDHITEIVTSRADEHGSAQVLVPSPLGEDSFEVVETFADTSVPHHSENVTIEHVELEHLNAHVIKNGPELQIEDAITGIVIETKTRSSC